MEEQKKKHKHSVFAAVGLLILTVGVFADQIGLGGGLGVGIKQAMVIVAGVLLILIGFKPCGCDKKKCC